MLETLILRHRSRAVETFQRLLPWHRLPSWLGVRALFELRETLRAQNLHDTEGVDAPSLPPSAARIAGQAAAPSARLRSADGSGNDPAQPRIGSAGTRFGRNLPLAELQRPTSEELITPNPRLVSEALLARRAFEPNPTLNLLAAAWIQFMTRDWFSHGQNDGRDPYRVPLPELDRWPEPALCVARTRRDPTRCPLSGALPTYANDVTHWWDASQIYGSSEPAQRALRTLHGGKLALDARGRLLRDAAGFERTGFVADTGWAALSLLHTLFAREHNAICDALHAAHPDWDDDELFGRAWLINAALLAKIHILEWTAAMLPHPTVRAAMSAGFWGTFGERIRKSFPQLGEPAIANSQRAEARVPYAITEEFVGVHRMHSLLPDEFSLHALGDHRLLKRCALPDLLGARGIRLLDQLGVENLFYSFGVAQPGALRLHNYPNHLRRLRRADGGLIDLASVDVLRDRERSLPRYNDFRRMLHLTPAADFEQLTDQPEWARELRDVYRDVNLVDLLPGTLAEPRPEGMAFGETVFRVLLLMACRRLESDRFFTTDFTSEVYSPLGMEWVRDNDLRSVLLRHCPSLSPALAQVENAFLPWQVVRLS